MACTLGTDRLRPGTAGLPAVTQINLLPWREKRREQRRKRYYAVLGVVAALGAVLVLAGNFLAGLQVEHQEARNRALQDEIRILDAQITRIRNLDRHRQALVERIDTIRELQAAGPVAVHLFDQIAHAVPEGIYFTDLKRQGERLAISARADSDARISALMRRLDASPWLRESSLRTIESREVEGRPLREFQFEVLQDSPRRPSAAGAS
jgi:type IV pilus assembly protein PilN